jgi:hypothetical protein
MQSDRPLASYRSGLYANSLLLNGVATERHRSKDNCCHPPPETSASIRSSPESSSKSALWKLFVPDVAKGQKEPFMAEQHGDKRDAGDIETRSAHATFLIDTRFPALTAATFCFHASA